MVKDLESDEPTLFTTLEEAEKSKALISGSPYILDKLEQLRQKIEDDINTILGVQNVGIAEKKEHLLTGEVDANNQAIDEADDEYLTIMQEFFTRIKNVFGYEVKVSLAHEKEEQENYNESEEDENE